MLRLIAISLVLSSLCSAKCLSIVQAAEKIGSEGCVAGKVLSVSPLPAGHFTLNFCEAEKACGFSVVVFRNDLRDVGTFANSRARTSRSTALSRNTAATPKSF
jgi:hypothetical protein